MNALSGAMKLFAFVLATLLATWILVLAGLNEEPDKTGSRADAAVPPSSPGQAQFDIRRTL
jgi:hypothetical protein